MTTEVQTKAEFSVAVGAMADALARCAAATQSPGAGPLPILSHVALRVAGGQVTLFATDLDWGVTVTLPLPHSEGEWTAAIPAGRTAELLKKFKPKDVVRFSRAPVEGPVIEVILECGRSTTRLKAIADDSFPEPPPSRDDFLFSTRGATLAKQLGLVRPFTAKNHERQVLGGVAISMNEYGVGYLATTTQIVANAVDEGAFLGPALPTEAVVLPAAACKQIELAAEACGEDEVIVYPAGQPESPRALVIDCPASAAPVDDQSGAEEPTETPPPRRTAHVTIFVRAMEGVYPDVLGKMQGQLTKDAESTAVVRPRALLDALGKVAAVAEVNQFGYTTVYLTPLVEEGAIRIRARGVQAGEGTDEVYAEVTGVSGHEHLFHLGNLRALLRTVSQGQPDDQTVKIAFRPLKPAVFTDALPAYTQSLFPMRPD